MEQQPRVGSTVYFYVRIDASGYNPPTPRAAIVTLIEEEPTGKRVMVPLRTGTMAAGSREIAEMRVTRVDLCVLHPTGYAFEQHAPYSETPRAGHWSWPAD